jgi:predicted  nucleic acid-binding Zn-ribbon protein
MVTGRSETNEPEARRKHLRQQIEALAALQRVDQSLRENTQALQAGESRVAALGEAVQVHETAVAAAKQELDELMSRQRDLEGRLQAAEAKMKDRRMRITRIRNDKELGLAKREVELLKEETGSLETELIAVLDQVEASTKMLEAGQAELASVSGERDSEAAQLRDTIGRLGAAIERDRRRRDQLIEGVDGELRRRYEMIFSRRGGVAVVPVRGGTCQGCHMHVPPQLFNQIQRNEQVILCPNCQRMLYWQPEGEEASE